MKQPDIFTQCMKEGLSLHRSGDFEGAKQHYARVLALDSNHADALNLMGLIDREQGRLDMAEERLGRAFKLKPLPDTGYNLAMTLKANRKPEAAIKLCRDILRTTPTHVNTAY